ncbi:AzlC family ABC transporter permease [Sulfitobacter sp. M22]|uniref:AzlC family ABC transporter permease n=1 Tax=Sulfitobacter sp. M22 TaxID=2675332 RepID=UPI001F4174AC|nr:AzlC family ABC transporter permease [Sulfitobacter sp. M22]MCF7728128.1 branched-chain amino acid ABC transporter permease [Sulfitobacter sp. M22]
MWHGARKIIPFGLGAAAYGFAFGVLAAQVGFPFWGVGLMSAATFAGSSQIVAVERFADGGLIAGAVVAGMALNLRYIGILASLSEVLRHTPLLKRLLAVHVTSDENWALTVAERARDPNVGDDFLIGSGLMQLAFWTASTALGALVGSGVPNLDVFGIGFAFTAAFIAMARGIWRGRQDLFPFGVSFSATILLVLSGWQAAFAILGGAGAGVTVATMRRVLFQRSGVQTPQNDRPGADA